jgi:hypothetical protein
MTKKQQQIYNWLLEHPGYLKKGLNWIKFYYPISNLDNDYKIALKQAKLNNKLKVILKSKDKEVTKLIPKNNPFVKNLKSIQDRLYTKSEAKLPKSNKVGLKRLYFDLETSPNIVYSWNIGYKLNISHDNIINERAIICACYKWEGEDKVHYLVWNKGDDGELIYRLYDVLMEADEIIGHNSDSYDVKWFRTRCLFHGILNMPEFKTIDTLKLSRRNFRFNSNKLDYIGQFLGLGKKLETGGFGLWKDIIANNNPESLNKMVTYCKQDVLLLEKVYNKLEGYSKPKTHIGLLAGNGKCSCPKCASNNYKLSKTRYSATGLEKKQLQCLDCSSYYTVSKTVYDNK